MLIVLMTKKNSDSNSGFGLTILEYSRVVYYSELPIPIHSFAEFVSCIEFSKTIYAEV